MNDSVPLSDAAWERRQRAQATAFDHIADRYDEAFPHKNGQVDLVTTLLNELPSEARVLDIGCGTGLPTAQQLVRGGCRVTGIDISEAMLDLARKNVPEGVFDCRDAVDIGPDLGRFDAVVSFFSLLMLPRAQVRSVLGKARELLEPGGWLGLGMVEADADDRPLAFLGEYVRVTGWPLEDLAEVVRSAGFDVVFSEARHYEPLVADAPPETQLFLSARRPDTG